MLQTITKLNRDFIKELTNSPYWKKRKVVIKSKTSSQYKIHFYNNDLLITVQLDKDGMFYYVNNENDFPLKSIQIKNMIKRIRLERELKNWGNVSQKKYNQIQARIFNNMVN